MPPPRGRLANDEKKLQIWIRLSPEPIQIGEMPRGSEKEAKAFAKYVSSWNKELIDVYTKIGDFVIRYKEGFELKEEEIR